MSDLSAMRQQRDELRAALDESLQKEKTLRDNEKRLLSEIATKEDALREREQFLQLLTDHMIDMITLIDTDGFTQYISPSYKTTLGYEASDMAGKSLTSFIHPEDMEIAAPAMMSVLKNQTPVSLTFRVRHRDGHYVWLETTGNLFRNIDGVVAGAVYTSRDVTDRIITQKALSKTEEMYRRIVESSVDILYTLDNTGRYTYFHPKIENLLGYKPSELVGRSYADFIAPDYRGQVTNRYVQHRQDNGVTHYQFDVLHKNGSRVPVEIYVSSLFDEHNQPIGRLGMVRDVSERKRAEEMSRQSEENFMKIFMTSPDCIAITRMSDSQIMEINQGFEAITGWTRSEARGKTAFDINFWYDISDRDLMVADLQAGRDILNREFQFRHKHGQVRTGIYSARHIRITDEDCLIFILQDITERRQMEEALQESEASYRQLFENAPTGIYRVDFKNGKFLRANDVILKNLGCTPEELTSLSPYDILTEESKKLLWDRVEKMAWGIAVPETVDYEVVDKTGRHRWVHLHNRNIYDKEGRVVASDVVAQDITKSKKAEEALTKSEEKYRKIFENAIEGIYQTTPDGRYLGINPAFARMFGYAAPQDMITSVTNIGRQLYVNPQDREDMIRMLREQDKVEGYEVEVYRKDKSRFWITMNIHTVRDAEGNILYLEGTNVDITERKSAEEEKRKLEERLQRAEKMEALGTLAGGVAHDLNNVLGVVTGYAELLMMETDKSSPARPRLKNIIEGGQRAAAIVQDLLTLARRGVSGRQVLNLNKIIVDSLRSPEMEKLRSLHSGVQIRTDLEPDLLNISGSSVHLGKSLYNLVSNAGEAMSGGGAVTIKTANQYIDKPIQGYDDVREGDYVILSVSDTGEGISATDLKRIFEPFYTKKVMGRSGTGLGLAVVWGTVKDHNGYINVQSEEGRGSQFTLYFPVTREEISAEAVPVSMSEYMGRGETILVVDDIKGQRELAADMLQRLNYRVSAVSSGEEAVFYLSDHAVDLLVLDMIMDPGMDGLDTYRKVLEGHPGQKAIIVSGFSESDRVHAAQALGAGAYVRKPYVFEKLGLAIRNELDRK